MKEPVKVITDAWVRVDPETPPRWRDVTEKDHGERIKDAAEALMPDIKRHVDGVTRMCVELETRADCSYGCGYEWELDDEGVPTCCDAAIQAWCDDQRVLKISGKPYKRMDHYGNVEKIGSTTK